MWQVPPIFVEVGFQMPFTFLPEPYDGFGVFTNYTYTDSEFTTPEGEKLTFPGSSENSFNLVGYYEKGGFSSRLAYNYRDSFLVEIGGTDGTGNEYVDSQSRLDFSLRYRFDNGWRLQADAQNLTEEQAYRYYDTPNRYEDLEVEGRIFSIGVGYNF